MNVDVYWNLHRHTFSVRSRESRLVVHHTDAIVLTGATFRVSTAGRLRVLSEGRKNVHAFVGGAWDGGLTAASLTGRLEQVTYNPYKLETFVRKASGEPIFEAPFVLLSHRKVWVPTCEG